MVGYWTRPVSLVKTKVIIDKCLVSSEDRHALLQLMHVPDPSDVCAIFFDKNVEDCRVNVCSRVNHPSIPSGDGVNAKRIVEGFSKKLEPPSVLEGFGRIEIIQSHDESDELARLFGAEPTSSSDFLFKFPRTQHLAAGVRNIKKIIRMFNNYILKLLFFKTLSCCESDGSGAAVTRDDLVLTPEDAANWLHGATVTVEEKIDGANLGVSLAADYTPRFQNRSHFVCSESSTQWKGLDRWWSEHSSTLCQVV